MSPTNPQLLNSAKYIARFFKTASAGGIVLMLTALLALIAANTPLNSYYILLLDTPVEVRVGAIEIAKPLLLWINDGLMTVFFFLVGLELKRELMEGELSDKRNIVLPGVGAIGGMLVPALIYVYFNYDDPSTISGWAIPAATDIAFALGVLMLLGSRVPPAIKIFLTSLAIFDDIGAIIIIAVFYTEDISTIALIVVACCIPILYLLNRNDIASRSAYIFIGTIMWVALLKSGVHATLSGVVLAMFIPMRLASNPDYSPLKSIEHDLHTTVAFFVLPVFAFANAGINLSGVGMEQLLHPVPLGIAAGLFIGKQIGIFSLCWLAVKMKLAQLPTGITWLSMYGTATLCGIGFTMSLFISSLAFDTGNVAITYDERLGIILGSLISGLAGYIILAKALPKKSQTDT